MPHVTRKPVPVSKAQPQARKGKKRQPREHRSSTPAPQPFAATTARNTYDQLRYDALCAYRDKCVDKARYHYTRIEHGCCRPGCDHHGAWKRWNDRLRNVDTHIQIGEQAGRWGVLAQELRELADA